MVLNTETIFYQRDGTVSPFYSLSVSNNPLFCSSGCQTNLNNTCNYGICKCGDNFAGINCLVIPRLIQD